MTETAPLGRRERKKAATRKRISDVATVMFLERGFDDVSIREIADAADVSPTTVFAHFSQKEALVFDEDDEQRERLVAAVRERPAGTSIAGAIRAYYEREIRSGAAEHGDDVARRFMEFLNATPALRDYAARMWLRHEDALAEAVAAELGEERPDPHVRAFARFVLQIQTMVNESDDPEATLDAGFAVLENGWAAVEHRVEHRGAGR
ncbi:TetR family transcriptional regulator [Microbacterium arborescens]|jgi:AcrR family transcriptional regulator|uniref:TetR family transcriptional regulator n=1 Tax=Microbacterium arborescens TaxID=33883 RepID=A0ABX2WL31_9MICO|nr:MULTISPECIES: TetR/AcrR family transcriptional regulator [Microbacterium]OAZ44038.1 TetR family transcriptional regulator [Microbacterium arborescens]POX66251.1 TetR family transcriptional regulator [Microbacterium sp. Ru50]